MAAKKAKKRNIGAKKDKIPKLTDKSKRRSGRLPKIKGIRLASRKTRKPVKKAKIVSLKSKSKIEKPVPIADKKVQKHVEIDLSDIEKIKEDLLRDSESRTKIIAQEEQRIERDMRKYYLIFSIILIILLIIFFFMRKG